MKNLLLFSILLTCQSLQAQDIALSDRSIYLEDDSFGRLSEMMGDDRCLLITCSTQAPACKEYIMYLNQFKENSNVDFRTILLVETGNRRFTDGTKEYYENQNLNVELAFAAGQRQVTPNLGNFNAFNRIIESGVQIEQYLITEDKNKTEALLTRFFIDKEYVDIASIKSGINFQDSIRKAKIIERRQNEERANKRPDPKPIKIIESDIKLIPPTSNFFTETGDPTTLERYLTSEYALLIIWREGIGGKQINDIDKFSKLHSFDYIAIYTGNERYYLNVPMKVIKNQWDFTSLNDPNGKMLIELHPNNTPPPWPQQFIIDREGTVIKSAVGYQKPEWLTEYISKFPPKKN